MFFNPFDLFQARFIASFGCNGFQHSSFAGFIKTEININPKSMQIAVISKNSQDDIIQQIKMFCLKFHKIHLNRLPETIIVDIHHLVLIDLVYNILIE